MARTIIFDPTPSVTAQVNPIPQTASSEAFGAGIARAATNLGAAISGFGEVRAQREQQKQDFLAQQKFMQFETGVQSDVDALERSMDPTGNGFSKNALTTYDKRAQEFLGSLPQGLREEYSQRVKTYGMQRAVSWAKREREQWDTYQTTETNTMLDQLATGITQYGADTVEGYLKQGEGIINSTSLPETKKAELVKAWKEKAEVSALLSMSPEQRKKALEGVFEMDQAQGPTPSSARLSHQIYTRGQQTSTYLQQRHGLSPIAAAAVAGHGIQESGLRASGAVGDKGTAFGIFQWRGDRLDNLKRFAAENGSDWKDFNTQLDFAAWEGEHGDAGARRAWKELQSAATLDEAVAAWMHFERPAGYTSDNPRGGHGYENRLAAARRIAGGEAGGPAINTRRQVEAPDARFADVPLETRLKLINQANNEIETATNQRKIETRAMIEIAADNAPTAIQNSGEYSGRQPSMEDFMDAYGPDQGEQKYRQYEAAVETSRQVFDMRMMPTADIEAMIEDSKPTATGEAAALENQQYQTLSKAAEATIKARNADPAGYVRQVFPDVAKAWENANQPGGYQAALALTAAAQQQLGIQNLKLLPDQLADNAVAKVKDETLSAGERVAPAMQAIFTTSDPVQRKAIFDQLVKAGLPETMEGVVRTFERGDQGAARRLMEAAMVDPAKLPGGLPSGTKPSDIDEEIQSQLMDDGQLGDIFYGLTEGSTDNMLAAQRDAKLLFNAVNLRVRRGESMDDAVTNAAKDLYGDVKVVTGNWDVNAKLLLPADQDEGAVLDGLAAELPNVREVLAKQLVPPANIATATGAQAILDATKENYIENVLSEGYFRSAGNGYVFFNPYTGAAVSDATGKPLLITLPDVPAAQTGTAPEGTSTAPPQPTPQQTEQALPPQSGFSDQLEQENAERQGIFQ